MNSTKRSTLEARRAEWYNGPCPDCQGTGGAVGFGERKIVCELCRGFGYKRPTEEQVRRFKDALTLAFRALRKKGYLARQNFMCCGGCAGSALGDRWEQKHGKDVPAKGVYYHRQDNERIPDTCETYLGWGGDGEEICAALREQGLRVEWDGTEMQRILVGLIP